MRQRSRVHSIALARILPTHAQQPTKTPSRSLPTRTQARTHANLGLQRVLPATEALNCDAPPRCAACVTALCRSATANRRHATHNVQVGTANGQATTLTGDVRHAACDRRRATPHVHRDEMRHGTGNRQRTPSGMGHWGLGQQAAKKGHADTVQRTAMPQTRTGKCALDN